MPSTVLGTGDTWSVRQTSSGSTKLPLQRRTMEGWVSQHAGQGTGWDGADVLSKDGSTTSPSRMVFFRVPREVGSMLPLENLEACDCFDQHSWVKETLCDFQGRGEKATFALLAVTLVLGAWRFPGSKEAKPQREVRASLPSSCPSLSVRRVSEQVLEQHGPPLLSQLRPWGPPH